MADNNDRPMLRVGGPDYILLLSILLLTLIGVVMVFSSSYYSASNSSAFNHDMYYFFRKELFFAVSGFIIALLLSKFPYQNYQNWSLIMYGVMLVLLVAVLFMGRTAGGATRWILGIQPSEVAKIVIIIVLSDFLSRHKQVTEHFVPLTIWLIGIVALPVFLVCLENLSTAIIMAVVSCGILFAAIRKWWYFIPWGSVGIGAVALIINMGDDFRGDRIQAWLDPAADKLGTGYQILQGLYAVGSGGLFGVGLGQSRQKLGFIPESHNDIIFAVICEELGLFGAGIIILLYMIMLWRCIKIAMDATSMFGTLVATGVGVMVGIQVFINISVVTNTIPNTGIPLPFISYGGTSMITLMIAMGIVLNISRHYRL